MRLAHSIPTPVGKPAGQYCSYPLREEFRKELEQELLACGMPPFCYRPEMSNNTWCYRKPVPGVFFQFVTTQKESRCEALFKNLKTPGTGSTFTLRA